MQNKVWSILNKEIWTEEGQNKIEQLHDAFVRIFEKVDKEDVRILYTGISESNLFQVMDIMEEYLKEE